MTTLRHRVLALLVASDLIYLISFLVAILLGALSTDEFALGVPLAGVGVIFIAERLRMRSPATRGEPRARHTHRHLRPRGGH